LRESGGNRRGDRCRRFRIGLSRCRRNGGGLGRIGLRLGDCRCGRRLGLAISLGQHSLPAEDQQGKRGHNPGKIFHIHIIHAVEWHLASISRCAA
jgi:hypothetical protein